MERLIAFIALTFVTGCASMTWKDGLTFALEAATLKVDRTTSFVTAGHTKKEDAQKTLAQARAALQSMADAQTLIAECEASKCDVSSLSQRLSLAAIDRWEIHLRQAGDINQADAAAAVRIAVQLAKKPGSGQAVEGNVTLSDFKALVERFRAATDRLAAALSS